MTGEVVDYDCLFKLVLVGDSGVGKTSLLTQFITESAPIQTQPTIGLEFHCKTLCLPNGARVKVQVWDTAGQEKYRAITTAHYRRAAGVLIVFDLTSQVSFLHVETWLMELYQVLARDTPILLIGNKVDLREMRQVAAETAKFFAEAHSLMYIETSALTTSSVKSAFAALVDAMYQKQVAPITTEGSIVLTHHGVQKTPEKQGCC